MLQPRHSENEQQLQVARILWAALNFSMIVYGVVLYTSGKISRIEAPSVNLQTIEMLALAANGMGLIVYFFYKSRVQTEPTLQKRFTGYIVCWALNEAITLMGFVAVFVGDSGNAFFYIANLVVAITGNLLTFPRKD